MRPPRAAALISLAMAALWLGCGASSRDLLREAEGAWRRGDYESALRLNNSLLVNDPGAKDAPQALLNIGNIYYRNLRRIGPAIETYTRLAEQHPGSAQEYQARMSLAEIYSNEVGDLTRAISEYDGILELPEVDNRTEIEFLRADAYFKKEDYARALRELQRIQESNPGGHLEDQVHLKIGNVYQIQKRYEEALAAFQKVSQSPCAVCRARAITNLMETYESLFDFDNAMAAIRKLDSSPENDLRIRQEVSRLEEKKRRLNSAGAGARIARGPA
ncbi:MAG: tetratricopeptide repeat protein [Acidobacteria bacterium]|nr:tetratricopeptide repeat protein [Acidobacteriota bacterium]